MLPSRIELDFARTRPRVSRLGAALLGVGLAATGWVAIDYQRSAARNEGLAAHLAATAPSGHAADLPDKAAVRATEDAREAVSELATPWSLLLQELELASQDSQGSVAVLAIEPDREKRQVRVLAEARTLPNALTYVERLQRSRALRFPALESHEVQAKDPERPVRFQIRADWRVL